MVLLGMVLLGEKIKNTQDSTKQTLKQLRTKLYASGFLLREGKRISGFQEGRIDPYSVELGK